MVDLFVARIFDLLTDRMVGLFVFESTDRTVQYKLNAQFLRLFGLHDDVNDAHRAGANRLQNKNNQKERATFFSPSENRCLLASNLRLEEREFVVDSGASMHMISIKDLSDADMDTLTKSCSPTIVITANREVQTQEEAIVYVKELDIFLTMKVLENTPAVLSLGKLCDEIAYSYEWINGKKYISLKTGLGFLARRTSFLLCYQVCQVHLLDLHQLHRHLEDRRVIPHHLLQSHLLHLQ